MCWLKVKVVGDGGVGKIFFFICWYKENFFLEDDILLFLGWEWVLFFV